MVALVVILIGFAAFMTYEGAQNDCAPQSQNCSPP
jgi:hypothetical protein